MSKAKVLLLTSQIVTERNYKRLYIDELTCKFELIIFDLTHLLHNEIYNVQISKQKKDLQVTHIKSNHDFYQHLKKLDQFDHIISFLGNVYEGNYWVYQSLMPYQNKLCVMARSGFPSQYKNYEKGIIKRIIFKIRRERSLLGLFRKLYFFVKKLTSKNHGMEVKYLVSAGEGITSQYSYFIGEKTKLVKSCSDDFLVSFEDMAKEIVGDYFVFLDENLIDHSDFLINNCSVEEEPIYYDELNSFFEFVEKKYDVEVVIAAHPRGDLSKTKSRFLGRKVFINKTCALVKFCQACITHASTSSNFAVIYKKPIIFLTSDRMMKKREDNELLASWFDLTPINMSHPKEFEKFDLELTVDEVLYDNFNKNFISYSIDCFVDYEFLTI